MHKTVGAFEWMQMIDILQNMGRQSQVRAPFVRRKVCLTWFLFYFYKNSTSIAAVAKKVDLRSYRITFIAYINIHKKEMVDMVQGNQS